MLMHHCDVCEKKTEVAANYTVKESAGVDGEVMIEMRIGAVQENGRICPTCADKILAPMLNRLLSQMHCDHNPAKEAEEAKQV